MAKVTSEAKDEVKERDVGGRPPIENPRSRKVWLYLTPQDADWWSEMGKELGCGSRGALIGEIVDSLCGGGLAPKAYERWYRRMEKACRAEGKTMWANLVPQHRPEARVREVSEEELEGLQEAEEAECEEMAWEYHKNEFKPVAVEIGKEKENDDER